MLYIRRPLLHDLNACLELDASYITQRVWQMNMRVDDKSIAVQFQQVHLPRPLTVQVPVPKENLLKCWQRGDCLFSAREQNDIIGFLHMIPDARGEVGHIHRHVVSPSHRRQGIGTGLINHALQWGQDHGLRSVILTLGTKNQPASAFYLANGFNFNGFTEEFYGEQEIRLQFARGVR